MKLPVPATEKGAAPVRQVRARALPFARSLLALMLLPGFGMLPGQQVPRPSKPDPRPTGVTKPANAITTARQRFLDMFARAYFPGRSGQLFVVPREGNFLTRPDPDVAYMHGSPWPYDISIPLMFVGPAVKPGVYSTTAAQQDVAPTLAAALGVWMPAATGRVLPVLRSGFSRPRVVFLLVLDGMRRDYFDRYADQMPTLSAVRGRAAWFSQAQVNYLPTNTAVGHSTMPRGPTRACTAFQSLTFTTASTSVAATSTRA